MRYMRYMRTGRICRLGWATCMAWSSCCCAQLRGFRSSCLEPKSCVIMFLLNYVLKPHSSAAAVLGRAEDERVTSRVLEEIEELAR